MHNRPSPDQLQNMAAESILGIPSLTDELTDEEASPLIAWGLAQAEVASRDARFGHLLPSMQADDRRAALVSRLSPVRRIMRTINTLSAERHELSPRALVEELAFIFEQAVQLPRPPILPVSSTTLAELAGWQEDMDNTAFVWVILALLESEPPIPGSTTTEES